MQKTTKNLATIIMFFVFCCLSSSALTSLPVSAEEITTSAGVNVKPAISINVTDSTIDLDFIPTTSKQFKFATTDVMVSTNSSTGYTIYLRTDNNYTSLKNTNVNTNTEIPTTASSLSGNNFMANTWGYNFYDPNNPNTTTNPGNTVNNSSIFSPITITDTKLVTTTKLTSNTIPASDNYKLSFGAAVDLGTVAGEYSNTVLISAIANS